MKKTTNNKIILYKTKDGKTEIEVNLENETVWLRQSEISDLFGKERSVIAKHIGNIFKEKEVDGKSNVHFLHIANSDKPVAFYSLDVILSVGYRTNSARAIEFRKWATSILKKYILQGYVVNEKRILEAKSKFNELKQTIAFLKKKSEAKLLKGQEKEIFNLLSDYSKTLTILEQYDKSKIKRISGGKSVFKITYKNCQDVIFDVRKQLIEKKEAGNLFGLERDKALKGIIGNLYQTFGGNELYKDLEAKASHLLYLIIKDHPFSDGNKRIGSFLFVYFLDKNKYLYRESGEKKINDNALAALALLVAESDPKEKDQMIALITQLLK